MMYAMKWIWPTNVMLMSIAWVFIGSCRASGYPLSKFEFIMKPRWNTICDALLPFSSFVPTIKEWWSYSLITSLPCPLTQIALLIAWPCGVVYSNRTFGVDGRATFFAGVSTFCWVMVIVLQIVLMFGIHKDRRYFRTPSNSTLIVSIATNSFRKFMNVIRIQGRFQDAQRLSEIGSVFVWGFWKVLGQKAASFLCFRYKSFSQEGFCTLDFWNSEWYFISLIG